MGKDVRFFKVGDQVFGFDRFGAGRMNESDRVLGTHSFPRGADTAISPAQGSGHPRSAHLPYLDIYLMSGRLKARYADGMFASESMECPRTVGRWRWTIATVLPSWRHLAQVVPTQRVSMVAQR